MYKIILSIAFVLISFNVFSQVTIGSPHEPNDGSLLDLKIRKTSQNTENSDRGLGLPRVELISLTAPGGDLKTTIKGATGNEEWDTQAHIGLLVYNVEKESCETEFGASKGGPYVWNGKRWEALLPDSYPSVTEVLDQRDGEVYLAGDFGDAGVWMLEHLRHDPIKAGRTDFVHSGEFSFTAKHFAYADGTFNGKPYDPQTAPSDKWKKKEGILYNWLAATDGQNPVRVDQGEVAGDTPGANEVESEAADGHIQGICPYGWHLPSDREWNDLEKEIATYPEKYSSYASAGNLDNPWNNSWRTAVGLRGNGTHTHARIMKSVCSAPNVDVPASCTLSASNMPIHNGFDAILVGLIGEDNFYIEYNKAAQFWTSSYSNHAGVIDGNSAWTRVLYCNGENYNGVHRNANFEISNLVSVRCKKN